MSQDSSIHIETLLWRNEKFTLAGTKMYLYAGDWMPFILYMHSEWEWRVDNYLKEDYYDSETHHSDYYDLCFKLLDEIDTDFG